MHISKLKVDEYYKTISNPLLIVKVTAFDDETVDYILNNPLGQAKSVRLSYFLKSVRPYPLVLGIIAFKGYEKLWL